MQAAFPLTGQRKANTCQNYQASSISQNLLPCLAVFECLDANIASPSSPSFPIYMVYGECWQGLTFSDLKSWHHPIANYNSTTQQGRIGGWSDFRIWSRLLITEESKPFTFSQTTEAGLIRSVFGLGLRELVCSQLLFALCAQNSNLMIYAFQLCHQGVCSISFNSIWFLSAWAC